MLLRIVLMTGNLQVEHLVGELCVNLSRSQRLNIFNAEYAESDAEFSEKDLDIFIGCFKAPNSLLTIKSASFRP